VWFTDRSGGVSVAPFDACNVGDHVHDDPAAVAKNRALVAEAAGLPGPQQWCWMNQVHGADVAVVAAADAAGPAPLVDALVTRTAGLPLAVVTADCAPIVLATGDAVAVVHAGHRGLLAGVVERALDTLRSVGRGAVHAVIGPCIRAAHYEFGTEDLAALVDAFGAEVASSTEWGTPAFDLPAGVRVALERGGVDDIGDVGHCTFASPEYFSYRRDGVTGRQATIAVLR
jgi:purine-nucleoside/S-methyl-5'-thioadenosine phosphorylase / adenosine deaminase